MLDDLYAADNEALINDMVARPAPAPKQSPKFSAWKTTTAAPRGVAAGANESAGFMADVLGAFGQTMAATDARSGGMFSAQSDDERKQEAAARDKMRQGIDMTSEAGDDFRSTAKSFVPDPESAHTAESLVFGLGRFATKAVGYSAMGGPVVGAGLTGLDEGMTTASDLKDKGVDIGTRTAVGAVAGVTSAASVVLPVAGKTLAQTAGLVAVGGPGAFIGQQAATRQILQDANYDDLASQYDPLDPVGLAVATLVPAGFGAFAMRGAARRTKGKTDAGLKVPEGESVPPPETEAQAPRPTREQADAARVELLSEHVQRAGLHAPEDAAGATAHQTAIAKAINQMSRGERVSVVDVLPAGSAQAAKLADMLGSVRTAREGLMAEGAALAAPGEIRKLRTELAQAQADYSTINDPSQIKTLAKQIQANDKVSYKEALAQAKKEIDGQVNDAQARLSRVEDLIASNAQAQRAFDAVSLLDREAKGLEAQRAQIDAPATRPTAVAAAAAETIKTTTAKAPQDGNPGNSDPVADRQGAAGGADSGAGVADRGRGANGANGVDTTPGQPGSPERAPGAGSDGNPRTQAVAEQAAKMRLAEIGKQFPDLEVQMDGMDGPVKLSDFLSEIQREADAEIKDAPLLQAAAECFLTFGL